MLTSSSEDEVPAVVIKKRKPKKSPKKKAKRSKAQVSGKVLHNFANF